MRTAWALVTTDVWLTVNAYSASIAAQDLSADASFPGPGHVYANGASLCQFSTVGRHLRSRQGHTDAYRVTRSHGQMQ